MRVPGLELTLDAGGVPWRETRLPGVGWLPLRVAESFPGAPADAPRESAVLIRMDPGCGYPPHRHAGVEEVLVLQGGYRDDAGRYTSGSYVRYEAGSEHAPVALGDPERPVGPDNPACVLFAIARGGVETLAQARSAAEPRGDAGSPHRPST